MYPNILGFEDSSYLLFFILGIVAAFFVVFFYLKKKHITKDAIIDLLICTCFAVALGVVLAMLFENLYELIALGSKYHWVWKMTFFGGLFGGVIGFLLSYRFILKKTTLKIEDLLVSAPAAITTAHFFGRIGCFLAGCCYGKPTDSWIGINFPGIGKVIPTQLIEAIFLFILSLVLLYFTFKKEFKYNFIIYLLSYCTFRFIIEFFRGDDRGAFLGIFSPSQVWCLILVVFCIPLYFIIKNVTSSNEQKE